MTLPARPALPDPVLEEFIALLREEIRAARSSGAARRTVIEAEVTLQGGRIVAAYVQPPRKGLDVVNG